MDVQPRPQSDLRGLKALVGILGVLVILGTALVIGVIIHRIYGKTSAPAPEAARVPGMSVTLPRAAAQLAAGEQIRGLAGAGGEIAIWVSGPHGDRVLVLDPATGKLAVAVSAAP